MYNKKFFFLVGLLLISIGYHASAASISPSTLQNGNNQLMLQYNYENQLSDYYVKIQVDFQLHLSQEQNIQIQINAADNRAFYFKLIGTQFASAIHMSSTADNKDITFQFSSDASTPQMYEGNITIQKKLARGPQVDTYNVTMSSDSASNSFSISKYIHHTDVVYAQIPVENRLTAGFLVFSFIAILIVTIPFALWYKNKKDIKSY